MAAEEVGLPKSTLQKAIKDLLPKEMRVAGDASELLIHCCNEFVQLVSTQASEVCDQEKRHTVNPEHVVKALEELQFASYVEAARALWTGWKDEAKEHKKQASRKASGVGSGMTQEQLIELQQRLFAQARAATLTSPLPACQLPELSELPQQQQQQQEQAQQQPQQQQQEQQAGEQEALPAADDAMEGDDDEQQQQQEGAA